MTDPKTPIPRPEREEQALREVGQTDVSRSAAAGLVTLFLATVAIVPLLEPVLSDPSNVVEVALEVVPEAGRAARRDGPFAANRALLAGMKRFENAIEEGSFLRAAVLPPTQRVLTNWLGVGNEQVYPGRDGWLFFRDDFDHVTGPGFLEPRVLKKARLGSARAADPLPAILALHRDLTARGIELVVMPTPVKPAVHPELLTRRASAERPFYNPSFRGFVGRLEAAGVIVFDPAVVFADAKARGEDPLYLRTDTHWTPRGIELAARGLATVLAARIEWRQEPSEPLVRRRVSVSGPGDIARMLAPGARTRGAAPGVGPAPDRPLSAPGSSETTSAPRIMTRRGTPWRPDRDAEILLLGDSFSNIYSDPALGWGTGAGLAEQLSFELGRPVDRIALNAGGAWSSRQALARGVGAGAPSNGGPEDGADAEPGRGRLRNKRVVVYQFAARELSRGDWKLIGLPALE